MCESLTEGERPINRYKSLFFLFKIVLFVQTLLPDVIQTAQLCINTLLAGLTDGIVWQYIRALVLKSEIGDYRR